MSDKGLWARVAMNDTAPRTPTPHRDAIAEMIAEMIGENYFIVWGELVAEWFVRGDNPFSPTRYPSGYMETANVLRGMRRLIASGDVVESESGDGVLFEDKVWEVSE